MQDMVKAATLAGPFDLRVEQFPRPDRLEPGAVLLRMLASGICGTDKHTYRGETEQYVGTDHARSTPFPIIQGHENVGVVVEIGPGGADAFDGSPLAVGDRVVPAPNRACGRCGPCTDGGFPYYFCENLENYGNSLSCAQPPHLFGGWAELLYLLPGTPVFKVPADLPTEVAVLTELFAVTHSLDLAAAMPRPGGYRPGDTVAVFGVGPVGLVHVAKAALTGAGRVVGVDRFAARLGIAEALGATDSVVADGRRRARRGGRPGVARAAGPTSWSTPPATRRASARALSLLRDGGTLLEVGAFVDLGSVPINPADVLGRNLTIVGVAGEDARVYDATLALLAEHHRRCRSTERSRTDSRSSRPSRPCAPRSTPTTP